MQPKTMIFVAVVLIIVSFLTLANRRGLIENIYNDAAEGLRAKVDQPNYDEEMLQQEARTIEMRVVRTDESLLYGGVLVGLLGLVFLHAGLVSGTGKPASDVGAPAPQLLPEEEVAALSSGPDEDAEAPAETEETAENA